MCTFTPAQQRKLGLLEAPKEISGRRKLIYTKLQRASLVATEGSYGCVYPYQYRGVLLAVKWFFNNSRFSDDVYQLELALAYKATQAKSEYIVQLMDYNDEERWLAMEWCPRGEIFHYIKDAPLSEDIAVYYTLQGCHALAALHSNGIFHLDYKTDNLLLNWKYQLKLCDFSCSISEEMIANDPNGTLLDKIFCKIRPKMQHGPPEWRISSYNNDVQSYSLEEQLLILERADIWFLGFALLTMLTSSYVFSDPLTGNPNESLFGLLELKQFVEFWSTVEAHLISVGRVLTISQRTRELLQKMLAVDPLQRPSAKELISLFPEDLPTADDVEAYMQHRQQIL